MTASGYTLRMSFGCERPDRRAFTSNFVPVPLLSPRQAVVLDYLAGLLTAREAWWAVTQLEREEGDPWIVGVDPEGPGC